MSYRSESKYWFWWPCSFICGTWSNWRKKVEFEVLCWVSEWQYKQVVMPVCPQHENPKNYQRIGGNICWAWMSQIKQGNDECIASESTCCGLADSVVTTTVFKYGYNMWPGDGKKTLLGTIFHIEWVFVWFLFWIRILSKFQCFLATTLMHFDQNFNILWPRC